MLKNEELEKKEERNKIYIENTNYLNPFYILDSKLSEEDLDIIIDELRLLKNKASNHID